LFTFCFFAQKNGLKERLNMSAMIFYGKTPVFRDVVKVLQKRVFDHYDTQNKKPVFKPVPTLLFEGSIKLHGSNCAVTFDIAQDEIYVQSRKHLITPSNDNDGFAQFVEQHASRFRDLMQFYADHYQWSQEEAGLITLYGEWAGAGIKEEVALAALSPTFYVFALRYAPLGYHNPFSQQDASVWFDSRYPSELGFVGLDHVLHYPTYQLEIDFENADTLREAEHQLHALTEKVARCCPVAQSQGVRGVGEGIVWVHQSPERRVLFKTKGIAHQVVKGDSIAVAIPLLSSTEAFVDYAVTQNRLKQIHSEMPDAGDALIFAEAVWQDVLAEESSVLMANGLSKAEIKEAVIRGSQKYYFSNLKNSGV
jgi:hypothetical protein